GLFTHPSAQVRGEARESYGDIRGELLTRLRSRDRHVARHIRCWLRPAWDLLAFSDDELRPDEDEEPPARQEAAREMMPAADLLALLDDPDASPRDLGDRLWTNDWSAYTRGERLRLRPVLPAHPDPLVRERAALCFEAWRD